MQRPILTVSEINRYIKDLLSTNIILSDLLVRGEISNYKYHYSGHMYFTLKDENSSIRCVMFKTYCDSLKFEPQDGMKVIIAGRVSVYEKDGSYQVYAEDMQPDGLGALHMAFEQLKQKLEKEGLFDQNAKKPIPMLPKSVGIVTSPTGAAIRDILNILGRRYYNISIKVLPVKVQGEGAGVQIANAIDLFNQLNNVDVVIIGRGGGSIEELWAFNEEIVARSIFNSKIPIISAVGHETDFTIADFVSDLRAPTPSAAAELVVPNKADVQATVLNYTARLNYAINNIISKKRMHLDSLTRAGLVSNPYDKIYQYRITLDVLVKSITKDIKYTMNSKDLELRQLIAKLAALNPLEVLKRGYGITLKNNCVVNSIDEIDEKDNIKIQYYDGVVECTVVGKDRGKVG